MPLEWTVHSYWWISRNGRLVEFWIEDDAPFTWDCLTPVVLEQLNGKYLNWGVVGVDKLVGACNNVRK